MHYVNFGGKYTIVNHLISAGANVNQQNNFGETALFCATKVEHHH